MIRLARQKELVVVSLALLAALGSWNMVLESVYDRVSPHDLAVLEHMEPAARVRAGRRAAELVKATEGSDQPLGLVLGLSTAYRGIDPDALGETDGLRWSNQSSMGGSFTEFRYYLEPLLVSGLRPRVVVIGGHAVWLADRGRAAASRGEPRESPSTVPLPWFWVARNRVRLAIDLVVERSRLDLERALGVDMAALFPGGGESPWGARFALLEHSPKRRMAVLRALWESFGWFDEGSYHPGSPEVGRLRSLIEALQARGAKVVFVLMPEPPIRRNKPPERARELLLETLASIDGVTVLDHRDVVSDAELFYDGMHLNRDGRAIYSGILAHDLAPITRALPTT